MSSCISSVALTKLPIHAFAGGDCGITPLLVMIGYIAFAGVEDQVAPIGVESNDPFITRSEVVIVQPVDGASLIPASGFELGGALLLASGSACSRPAVAQPINQHALIAGRIQVVTFIART